MRNEVIKNELWDHLDQRSILQILKTQITNLEVSPPLRKMNHIQN